MRLIDADRLLEEMEEPLNWTNSESEIQEQLDYDHFIAMIEGQPTAYDLDKVVAGLEAEEAKELRKMNEANQSYYIARYGARAGAFRRAIEIVKGGTDDGRGEMDQGHNGHFRRRKNSADRKPSRS